MDDSDDPIRKLLEQTGWSYQDVLKKLEKYKNLRPANADSPSSKRNVENKIDPLASVDSKPTDTEIVESKPKDELNTPNGEEATKLNSPESIFKNDDIINTETEVEECNKSIDDTETDIEYNEKKYINSEDTEENMSSENCVDELDCVEVEECNKSIDDTETDTEYNQKKDMSSEDTEENMSSENCVDDLDCVEENIITDVDNISALTSENTKNKATANINRIVESDIESEQQHKADHKGIMDNKREQPCFTIAKRFVENMCERLEIENTKEYGKNNTKPGNDKNLESKDYDTCLYKDDNDTTENQSNNTVEQECEKETTQSTQSINDKASTLPTKNASSEECVLITDNRITERNVQVGAQQTFIDQNISKPTKLKNNLLRERLRLLRKYKNLHKKKLKKRAEGDNKILESEDIRSKLKEQLELLRNKRKTPDLPLISSPDKASCNSKLGAHNKNRLNQITSALLEKLNGNMFSKNISDLSENDACVQEDSDIDIDSVMTRSDNILSNESSFMIVEVIGGYKSPTPEPQLTCNDIDIKDSEDLIEQPSTAASDASNNDIDIKDSEDLIEQPSTAASDASNNDIDIKDSEDLIEQPSTAASDASKLNDDALNLSEEISPPANGIKPTKTNDVTKIKGWKNKKFAIAQEKQKKPSEKLLQMLSDDFDNDTKTTAVKSDKELSAVEPNSSLKNSDEDNSSAGKSAFVSDALDQYLTENAQLNISYEIPKLEAEQTITKTYIDIKFPEFPQKNDRRPSFLKSKDTYKPKTLAEKRKMLIKSQGPQIKDFMVNMTSKQRKDYEESVSNMRKKLLEENVPFTRRCFATSTSIINTPSFVVYNGRRYKVPYSKTKEIVAEIKDRRKMYKSAANTQPFKKYKEFKGYPKKPSLLNSLKVEVKKQEYDPDEWKSVEVKLPKLSLEITPEVGKCIDPKIEHLIRFDHTITQDRIDFALSALKIKNCISNIQKITFPLAYCNNEDRMMMRKSLLPIAPPEKISMPKITETDSEIAESVQIVVNKLLDYIDISECSKGIVKEELCGSPDLPLAPVEDAPVKKRKRGRKPVHGPKNVRTATLEMKRLNCKIVSISLDEEHGDNKPCQKEFCKLGCICNSIESNHRNLLSNHCGLPGCMFNCSCNYKKEVGQNISLPMGADIFSEGIINRLQDEAKKDLAKVEKEFTQTIIKTNNQIIIVGDSKERRRRLTKMPKKYDDFVEEDFIEKSPTKPSASRKAPLVETAYANSIVKPCFIKLLKHDLNDIIPFCMVHMLYKCHCRNKAVFDSSADDANIVGCKVLKAPEPSPSKPHLVKHKIYARNDKTFNKEIHSSRTRGLSTSYYIVRNKSLSHKNKLIRSSKKLQNHLESYLRANSGSILGESDEEPPPRPTPVVEEISRDSVPETIKRKRKQSLVVLEDNNANDTLIVTSSAQPKVSEMKELKLQRRKVRLNTKHFGQEFLSIAKQVIPEPPPEKTPDTDKGKKKFLRLINRKNAQLRLLPWSTLAMRYENGSFQLWYTNYSKAPQLIITENGRRPSTNHYNIKLFEQLTVGSAIPCDIIRWLTSRTVPLGKSPDQILLVLAYSNSFWKICGICRKDDSSGDNLSISLIDDYCSVEDSEDEQPPVIDLEVNDNNEKLPEATTNDDTGVQDEGTEAVVHENLEENKKIMYCSRRRFQPKKLISANDDGLNIQQVLWASIPSVTLACKWRVICMNLGFAYLSLSRSSYTIKYDDVMKAVKLAQTENITIVLKSKELQKNYPHRNFGIYCVHNYMDKVFVGPYFLNENHDLDTLSFVNGVLVNTNLFNQIKGKNVPGSGFWFHQMTTSEDKSIDDDVTIIHDPLEMVDLTCDSDDELPSEVSKSTSPKQSTLLELILRQNQNDNEEITKVEKALDSLLKTGELNVSQTVLSDTVSTSQTRPIPKVNSATRNLTKNLIKDRIRCDSRYDDDDKMVVDEASENDSNCSNINDEIEIDEEGVMSYNMDESKLKYILTNIPTMGYIVAYRFENHVDVICPITQTMKRFPTAKIVLAAVESVLSKRFILIPSTFKLQCRFVDEVEDDVTPLDRTILNGYHIAGAFGVKNIFACTVSVLKDLGMDKNEITQTLVHREQKLLLPPINELARLLKIPLTTGPLSECLSNILEGTRKEMEILQKERHSFANEKLGLERRKKLLAEQRSKLIADLPSEQQSKVQKELDQILRFNSEKESVSTLLDVPDKSDSISFDLISNKKIKDAQLATDDPIKVPDDSDEAEVSHLVPKLCPASTAKLKLTRKPYINSDVSDVSLLSKKKVETAGKSSIRSLLTANSSKEGSNKFVVVTRKQSTPTWVLSTGNTDLKKCSFQMKSAQAVQTEKVLFKDFPFVVSKNMVKTINSTQKANQVLTGVNAVQLLPNDANQVQPGFTAVSALNKNPRVSCSTMHTVITSASGGTTVQSVAAASVPSVSTISKSKLVNIVQPTRLAYTRVLPISGNINNSSMATLTPVPKSVVPKSVVPKSVITKTSSNYIAVKEGNDTKYFQIISSDKDHPRLKPLQPVKRSGSSVVAHLPAKKIAAGTSLLTNNHNKTDT